MNPSNTLDFIGLVVGFVLTLMIFSYIFGDNLLFRIASYAFIGAAAGYATAMVLVTLIWQRLVLSLIQNPAESLAVAVPGFILGIWLLLKVSPRLSNLGSLPMSFLVGVAAATIVGGAILGTLFPQMNATMNALNLAAGDSGQLSGGGVDLILWMVNGLLIIFGSITTLAYFQFGSRAQQAGQNSPFQVLVLRMAQIGKGFIAVALGALFAGVYAAALLAFVERVTFSWNLIWQLIGLLFPTT